MGNSDICSLDGANEIRDHGIVDHHGDGVRALERAHNRTLVPLD